MVCKNCGVAKAQPNTNFCSESCFTEYLGKLMSGAIIKAVYGRLNA